MAEDYLSEPENENEATALLDKSFFGQKDLEVGKVCKVRIVHIYEDEVEVAYVKHKEEKEDQSEAESQIDSMAERNL
jgi:hypothetical protein